MESVYGFQIVLVQISRKPTRRIYTDLSIRPRMHYYVLDLEQRAGTSVHHYFQYHLVAGPGPGLLAMSPNWNYL